MQEYHYNTRYLSITGCKVVNDVIILCLPLASPLQLTLTTYGGPGILCFLEFYHQYTRVVHMQKAKDLLCCCFSSRNTRAVPLSGSTVTTISHDKTLTTRLFMLYEYQINFHVYELIRGHKLLFFSPWKWGCTN